MSFLMLDQDFLLNSPIIDAIELNSKDKDKLGYFGYDVLNDVPYIKFPELSDDDNFHIYLAVKEVLARSKRENDYNEVAITYDMNNIDLADDSTYALVYGDSHSVKFMSDEKTQSIYANAEGLYVINLHNHPNDSGFSLEDFGIFLLDEKIKLMMIVNTKGEVSFIKRNELERYNHIYENALLKNITDIKERIISSENTNILDLLTNEEKNVIVSDIVDKISKCGIDYCGWINKKTVKDLAFMDYETDLEDEYER